MKINEQKEAEQRKQCSYRQKDRRLKKLYKRCKFWLIWLIAKDKHKLVLDASSR